MQSDQILQAKWSHEERRAMPLKMVQQVSGEKQGSSQARPRPVPAVYQSEQRDIRASLLKLQRTHGNLYVQRLLAMARHGEGEPKGISEVEAAIERARGGGRALDNGIRLKMESAFGADFSGVRVHTGPEAHSLSRAVEATAFTTGQEIFFSSGAYDPASSAGRQLLAHELTHVIQQNGGGVSGGAQRAPLQRYGSEYERAQTMGRKVQAKLTVSQPQDPDEVQAEEIAQRVTSILDRAPSEITPAGDPFVSASSGPVQMHAAVLQRQPANEEPTSYREGRTQVVPGSSSGSKTPTQEQIVALRAVQPKINALEGKADVVNASLSSMLAESDGLLAQIDGDLDTMTKKYQQAYKRHEAALKKAGTALAGDELIISIVVGVALGAVAGKMLEAIGSVATIEQMIKNANTSMEAAGVSGGTLQRVAGLPVKAAEAASRAAGKAVAGSESQTAVPQPGADPATRELKIMTQISKLKSDVIRVARMAIDLKPLDKAVTELVRDIALYIEKGSGTSVADPVDVVLQKADKLARHGKDAYDNAQKAIKDNWKGVRSMAASMSSAVSETSVDSLEERLWIEWIAGLDPKTQLSVLDKLEGGIDGRFLPQKVIDLLGVNTGIYTTRSDLLKMHFNAQDAQRAQAQVGKSGTYIGPASKTTFRSGGRVYIGGDDFPARIEAVKWWPILAEEPNGRALSVVVVGTYNTSADAGTDTGSLKSRERFGLVVQAPAESIKRG